MFYRAVINLDYTRPSRRANKTEYDRMGRALQQLEVALLQLGWKLSETTAFTLETEKLDLVWRGIGLVARQNKDPGEPSAVTFHIQGFSGPDGRRLAAEKNYPNALIDVGKKPFP